jgi:hypothetical protein
VAAVPGPAFWLGGHFKLAPQARDGGPVSMRAQEARPLPPQGPGWPGSLDPPPGSSRPG